MCGVARDAIWKDTVTRHNTCEELLKKIFVLGWNGLLCAARKNGEDVCLLVAGIAVPAALPWCCCVRPAAVGVLLAHGCPWIMDVEAASHSRSHCVLFSLSRDFLGTARSDETAGIGIIQCHATVPWSNWMRLVWSRGTGAGWKAGRAVWRFCCFVQASNVRTVTSISKKKRNGFKFWIESTFWISIKFIWNIISISYSKYIYCKMCFIINQTTLVHHKKCWYFLRSIHVRVSLCLPRQM